MKKVLLNTVLHLFYLAYDRCLKSHGKEPLKHHKMLNVLGQICYHLEQARLEFLKLSNPD